MDLPETEWRQRLSPEQYSVLREGSTERAFAGILNDNKAPGTYRCAGCGSALFTKYQPLWNPRMGLGKPFLGKVQPGVFYPLNVVLLLPVPLGLDLFYTLHLAIAASRDLRLCTLDRRLAEAAAEVGVWVELI